MAARAMCPSSKGNVPLGKGKNILYIEEDFMTATRLQDAAYTSLATLYQRQKFGSGLCFSIFMLPSVSSV